MIYTPEMMRTLARQHDEDSDTRAALMQAADTISLLSEIVCKYEDALQEVKKFATDVHGITAYRCFRVANQALKGE